MAEVLKEKCAAVNEEVLERVIFPEKQQIVVRTCFQAAKLTNIHTKCALHDRLDL